MKRRGGTGYGIALWILLLQALIPGRAGRAQEVFRIRGVVKEQRGGSPVADARVAVLEVQESRFTDAGGEFRISLPKRGFFTFRILAGERVVQLRREVRYDGETILLYLDPEARPTLEEGIQVVGQRDRTKLSRYSLTGEEMRRLPGVYGDSLKAVSTLPGVSEAAPPGYLPGVNLLTSARVGGLSLGPPYQNSVRGPLVMRGAGARASSFYLDDFKIQYPFHLGDQSSVINNQMIRGVDIFTGSLPPRYGNATGGVVAIRGPSSVKKASGHVNLALFLADAYYETPLWNDTSYFAGSVRKSYPNYTLLKTYPDAIPPNAKYADYQDGQFKIGFRPLPLHEITLIYFGARDRLHYTKTVAEASRENSDSSLLSGFLGGNTTDFNTNESDTRPPVGIDRNFHTQGIRYDFSWRGIVHNTLQLQVSRFQEEFDLDFRSPFTGETIFGFRILDARQEESYRNETRVELVRGHLALTAGVESARNRLELSMKNLTPSKTINPNTPDFVDILNQLVEENRTFRALYDGDRTYSRIHSAYGELEWEYGNFRLTPGVRVDSYTLSRSTGVGPRMGAEYVIESTSTTLLAGAGRFFNAPPGGEYVSEEAGNPWLRMEESEHMAVGVLQQLGREWQVKVEGYRNLFSSLVTEDRWIVRPLSFRTNKRDLLEKIDEIRKDPLEARPLYYSNDGTGESRGVEIFIKKSKPPGENGLFGWLSLTWSLTKRNNHQTRLDDNEESKLNARNLNREALSYFEWDGLTGIYYDSGELELYPDNDREELYDLDRTHMASLVLGYRFNASWQAGIHLRYATSTPLTPVVGTEDQTLSFAGRPTFVPKYSDFYNSDRLMPYRRLDLRVDHFLNYDWGYANLYLELINVTGQRNPESENFSFLYPYTKGTNPSPQYESTYMETPLPGDRTLYLPLVNLGMELRF